MIVPQYIYGSNDDLQRYFALLLQNMQSDLSNNGWQVPELSASNVTEITSSTFQPVMRPGTLWFNRDEAPDGKLQFITVQAIPAGQVGGPANATIETIMSA